MNLPLTEEFVTELLTTVLSDKKAKEDLLNLLSFTSDDDHAKEGSREAKSWALRLWWGILYKPVISPFLIEVVNRHNRYWVKRPEPLPVDFPSRIR